MADISPVSASSLLASLNQTKIKSTDPALYEVIKRLVMNIDTNNKSTSDAVNANSGTIAQLTDAELLTADDEHVLLPLSRELLPGTNISFDDSLPNKRTVNASGSGGGGTSGPSIVLFEDNANEDFPSVIPGPKGDTGATGATGAQGSSGLILLNDIDAPNEPLLIPGLQGLMGLQGIMGPPGLDGINSEEWANTIPPGISQAGRLINIQIFTLTGSFTYTPTPGTNSIIFQLQGGGGGAGGAITNSAGFCSIPQSGAGGGWLQKRLTTKFSGTGSVGAGGAGGAAGNNNGTAGSDTTFTDGSGTTYTASGGNKGNSSSANFLTPPAHRAPGQPGGTGTNGDLNISGAVGVFGLAISTSEGSTTSGGDSYFGRGGPATGLTGTVNSSIAGQNGTGYGGGGGGGLVLGTGASVAGGNGANGVAIFYEYS